MKDFAQVTAPVRWRKAAAFIAAAFVVKLIVLLQLWDHPLLQPHGELDTAYYIELSRRVATEGVLAPIGAFFVSPLYVYFLASVFAAGGSLFAAQVIQIVLGAAAVGMLFATARHWFGDRPAAVAAVLAILSGPFTFNEVLILQSALDPFLVSATLYSLTRTTVTGGSLAFAAAGGSLGLLALNRPNAVVFAIAAAIGVALMQLHAPAAEPKPRGRRPVRTNARLVGPAVLVASFLAVLGANAARNYAVSGDAVLIASHGGLNLYIGNHERADGTYTPVAGITPSIAGQATDSKRVAESSLGRSLSPGEVSSYFTRRAIDWVTGHPADAVRLTLRKAAILLNSIDVPLNHSYAFYAREPAAFLRVLMVGPWLLLPFGLLGLFWPGLRVNHRGYWIWAMFVPVYGAAVVLFFVTDRYRMPMFVPLCATAGASLDRIFDLARARQIGALRWPAAALTGLTLLAFADLGLDSGIGGEQTRQAVFLVEQGSPAEAIEYVAQIKSGHSHPGVLQFRVGQALLDAGRYDLAASFFREAIAIDGPQPAIRLALGEALMRTGATGEALGHLQAAYDGGQQTDIAGPLLVRALVLVGRQEDAVRRLAEMPDSIAAGASTEDTALDFGTLALEHGATREAIRWLKLAAVRAPNRAETQEKLGLAIFLAGDVRNAVAYLERAHELDRQSASICLNLAVVYAELGRLAEARNLALEARRLDPTEPRTAALLKALRQ